MSGSRTRTCAWPAVGLSMGGFGALSYAARHPVFTLATTTP